MPQNHLTRMDEVEAFVPAAVLFALEGRDLAKRRVKVKGTGVKATQHRNNSQDSDLDMTVSHLVNATTSPFWTYKALAQEAAHLVRDVADEFGLDQAEITEFAQKRFYSRRLAEAKYRAENP